MFRLLLVVVLTTPRVTGLVVKLLPSSETGETLKKLMSQAGVGRLAALSRFNSTLLKFSKHPHVEPYYSPLPWIILCSTFVAVCSYWILLMCCVTGDKRAQNKEESDAKPEIPPEKLRYAEEQLYPWLKQAREQRASVGEVVDSKPQNNAMLSTAAEPVTTSVRLASEPPRAYVASSSLRPAAITHTSPMPGLRTVTSSWNSERRFVSSPIGSVRPCVAKSLPAVSFPQSAATQSAYVLSSPRASASAKVRSVSSPSKTQSTRLLSNVNMEVPSPPPSDPQIFNIATPRIPTSSGAATSIQPAATQSLPTRRILGTVSAFTSLPEARPRSTSPIYVRSM